MLAPHSSDPDFGTRHFGSAQLGDRRRTRRLVAAANQLSRHPGETLPKKFHDPAALEGFYDLVNMPQVTHARVLEPHRELVRARIAAAAETVLILHDTTELDYTGKHSLHGELGQIGNGSRRGYLCHHGLAVNGAGTEVLGLVYQILQTRPVVARGEKTKAKRERQDRESRLWVQGLQASRVTGGGLVVHVADRGADTFEVLQEAQQQQQHLVVRSLHSRSIRPGHGVAAAAAPKTALHAWAATLPELGRYEVQVGARPAQRRTDRKSRLAQPARTATVALAAGPVQVQAPHVARGLHSKAPVELWLVRVWEPQPPAGAEPLEWSLLTTVSTTTFAEARTVAGWYEQRWVIEELHKGMKTGCQIEALQFTTTAALQPAIGILSVVAVGLLQLREAARRPDATTRLATEVVSAELVEVLSSWRHAGRPNLQWTVREFYLALGRLGGHQNRKSDPLPGWLVLWRGWQSLQDMLLGFRCQPRCA